MGERDLKLEQRSFAKKIFGSDPENWRNCKKTFVYLIRGKKNEIEDKAGENHTFEDS